MARFAWLLAVPVVAVACSSAGSTTAPTSTPGYPIVLTTPCDITIDAPPVLGRSHVAIGTPVTYDSNPPSSGDHYPIWAAYQAYTAPVDRRYYVHDLEHGAVVFVYNCALTSASCGDIVQALQQASDALPDDPLCASAGEGVRVRTVITPDPLLDVPVAAAAWGFTYRAQCADQASLVSFAKAHYGHGPETLCANGTSQFYRALRRPRGRPTLHEAHVLSPLSFTPEFRRKMAELPRASREEWLASLAARVAVLRASHGPGGGTGPALQSLEAELAEVARGCRQDLVSHVEHQLGPFEPLYLRALLEVPRERFVRDEDLAHSAEDTPLPLDDEGLATVSAPHAYLLSYRLLELAPGDSLLELGSGSGYGAALAAYIVGGEGWVVTVEIDPQLAEWATARLSGMPNVRVRRGDAMDAAATGASAKKICVTFAVDAVPQAWLSMIPEGGRLVAPVGPRAGDQRLVRAVRKNGRLDVSEHGAVRYVKNRSTTK